MSGPGDDLGPVPDGRDAEDYDRLRRRVLWLLPTGLYVVGSRAHRDGVAHHNLMTANLVVQVALVPKLVAVSIEAQSLTRSLVESGGAFSVSMLDRQDRALVRKFVKPVSDVEVAMGGEVTALAGEPVLTAVTGAPILARAAAWVDCAVRRTVDLGSHVLFIGEVVDAGERSEPGADPPQVLRMEDTRMHYGG